MQPFEVYDLNNFTYLLENRYNTYLKNNKFNKITFDEYKYLIEINKIKFKFPEVSDQWTYVFLSNLYKHFVEIIEIKKK